jgi:plasmid stabilization system protein ParE
VKPLRFHPDVNIDIKGSYEWYEEKSKGLGERFISELEHAYEAIGYFPQTWSPFEHGFHRYILPRFPFSVIYKDTSDIVYVLAVMHNSRKPGYWKERK